MIRLLLISTLFAAFATPNASSASGIKQPAGWEVEYVNASCIVNKGAAGVANDPPWLIKMGYLHGDQLIFMFSASNSGAQNLKIPKGLSAWFVVDGVNFKSGGISNQSGELVLPVENSIRLQKALFSANTLGIRIQHQNQPKPIELLSLDLGNIQGAMEWLRSCNGIGVGALPRR